MHLTKQLKANYLAEQCLTITHLQYQGVREFLHIDEFRQCPYQFRQLVVKHERCVVF